ncbi:glycerol-3-phosphate 1-O-acyltransferase PlsY [Denitratisoma oestradiolicum]|uniref:Glycerol-3-phosphate acyltransferase n=1 Tax=Denitratisoma oestradiolicum TaxID=311182 RepID=A0A6S6XZV5_9PROT|nr:glycerol-3-phosphate 1-O-acyltransferase PlsY [Denitratisoma oestradiolicum]TWO81690.1 glycerol-3-phosphate acyltransferase [Denitratisoma oestradiolicum]CAB1370638.1 1-acyl glycerol-3-phosphate synthetase component [Denitratisoma oestradiolicum]
MKLLLFVLLGYLLGSLPFAVIVSRLFGLADPRSFGSGNPGATNVLRTGNKPAAVLTLLGDALKGWAAMIIAGALGGDGTGIAAAGLAAFVGHLFPLFLGFKGGKGVATALGVLTGFSGWLALICAGTWLAAALISRYSSLAALVAAVTAPAAGWALGLSQEALSVLVVMGGLLILRHKDNIKRLLAGTESRLGGKKKGAGSAP